MLRVPALAAHLAFGVMAVAGRPLAAQQAGGGTSVPAPAPAVLSGAYRFADGRHVTVAPDAEPGTYRYRVLETGESRVLVLSADGDFTAGPSWGARTPVALRVAPRLATDGRTVAALTWRAVAGGTIVGRTTGSDAGRGPVAAVRVASRVPVDVDTTSFVSDGVRLVGTFFLPARAGRAARVPLVVVAHGSECAPTAAADLPWDFTAFGVGVFFYDKRGCGASGGHYTQDLPQLAADLVRAVDVASRHPWVDTTRLGVAGYSQGGWIGPRAAAASPRIRFVVVGYGLAESMAAQDRAATLLALREAGVRGADLAHAERLIDATHRLLASGLTTGFAELDSLRRAYAGAPWLTALTPKLATWAVLQVPDSATGVRVARERGLASPAVWTADPRPVLEQVRVPQLWLLAGDDHTAPSAETAARLRALRRRGYPIEVVVYPDADHGMVHVERRDGARVVTGFEPGYFDRQAAWIHALGGAPDPRSAARRLTRR